MVHVQMVALSCKESANQRAATVNAGAASVRHGGSRAIIVAAVHFSSLNSKGFRHLLACCQEIVAE